MSHEDSRVRRASYDDLPRVVRVVKTTFPQDFDFGKGFDPSAAYDMFAAAFEDPNELLCVATRGRDRDVVGFVYYVNKPPTNGTVVLEMIGVRKGLQSQGIGTKLLTEADDLAVRYFRDECGVKNLATIVLSTSGDNPVGQRLYRKTGYKHVGTIPGLVGEGNVEFVMLKKVGDVAYRKNLWTEGGAR